ncbi:complex I assembly factor ACAD9, mitochondrial [Culicoides brevitarsis]|uniref:complex I assembly factor ACAD9, mitochondrial n=1 Tax=Culicoides brevitarsis TaxID=469753 RepID=UPI00307BB26D
MSLLLKHISRHCQKVHRVRHPIFRRCLASQASEKAEVEKKDEKLELDFRKFDLQARIVKKQPALPPLIKEMFLGRIDEKYFPYLEVIKKEHVDKYFAERQQKTAEFLSQTADPKNCLSNLRSSDCLGYSIPKEFNGNGYELTETTLEAELESCNFAASSILNQHRLVVQAIVDFGSDEQKAKYLPKLANGELIGTVAVFEREICEDRPFHTLATLTNDNNFELNGEKDFVINGEKANLFLVVASSMKRIHIKKEIPGVSAFLVEANDPGVVRGKKIDTLGCEEVEKCTLTFGKVPLGANRVIGNINEVDVVAKKLIQMIRLQATTMASQVMKRTINHFTRYCIETKITNGYPKDLEITSVRLGRMAAKAYALDSMIYFTTQLADAYESQDIDLEIAATKLFAMQSLIDMTSLPFHTIGQKATLTDEITAKNARDALQLLSQGDTMDMIKMYLGLQAIQYAAQDLQDVVSENRNPTDHPQKTFFKGLFESGSPLDRIKITMHFDHNLHPSLKAAGEMLEVAMKRVNIAMEEALTRHGQEIVLAHTEIERLSRCATLLYAVLATISRASRSYCIGVRYCDDEIMLAHTFTMEVFDEIKILTEQIVDNAYTTHDKNHKRIAQQLYDSKRYFFEHPLLRVF